MATGFNGAMTPWAPSPHLALSAGDAIEIAAAAGGPSRAGGQKTRGGIINGTEFNFARAVICARWRSHRRGRRHAAFALNVLSFASVIAIVAR